MLSHHKMRDNVKAAISRQLVHAQMDHARTYQVPKNVWDIINDVGESGEEESLLESELNVQFEVGEDGERLWLVDLTEKCIWCHTKIEVKMPIKLIDVSITFSHTEMFNRQQGVFEAGFEYPCL